MSMSCMCDRKYVISRLIFSYWARWSLTMVEGRKIDLSACRGVEKYIGSPGDHDHLIRKEEKMWVGVSDGGGVRLSKIRFFRLKVCNFRIFCQNF